MSNYPTFFEQLKTDMERRPEVYRAGYDKYTEQWLGDQGIHVNDPTKYVNITPNIMADMREDYHDKLLREAKERREQRELEEWNNRPFLFKFCSRLSEVFLKYLDKN